MLETFALLLAGVASGALNAIGGGGTFVALPALVAAGLPPVAANASSTVALLPGALASAWAYRGDVAQVGTPTRAALTTASLLGSAAGAALLLVLPAESFDAAVPWLLAFATVVLAFGRAFSRLLGAALGRSIGFGARGVLLGQVVLAAYGGYFGGAVGILMLAWWNLGLGLDPAKGNSARVVQLGAIYATAAVFFLIASDVLRYPAQVGAVLLGALVGGFAGGHGARRLPAPVLRALVLTTATAMTILYSLKP